MEPISFHLPHRPDSECRRTGPDVADEFHETWRRIKIRHNESRGKQIADYSCTESCSAQKHVRGGNVQVIDNQSILRLASRTSRPSKADLCARRIAKSALDGCVGTISGCVPLTSILPPAGQTQFGFDLQSARNVSP